MVNFQPGSKWGLALYGGELSIFELTSPITYDFVWPCRRRILLPQLGPRTHVNDPLYVIIYSPKPFSGLTPLVYSPLRSPSLQPHKQTLRAITADNPILMYASGNYIIIIIYICLIIIIILVSININPKTISRQRQINQYITKTWKAAYHFALRNLLLYIYIG